jgi:hypothetical protein
MRTVRTTVIGMLVACMATAAPVAAMAAPGERAVTTARATSAGGSDRALAALEAVEQALRGAPHERRTAPEAQQGRQLTVLLRDLRLRLDELDGEDRLRAKSYLARPDGDRTPSGEPVSGAAATNKDDCSVAATPGSHVCVHWVTTGADAPPLTDSDLDGVPNQVETTRDVFNEVWSRIVTDGGYRAPLADLGPEADQGPDEKLDVYLANLGSRGLYGYCGTDDTTKARAVPAFCSLDDDFAEFGGKPLENLQVTAAHEFFHAVQFAYDSWEDAWLLEGTAAWVEDELYDDVDDNLQYLANSPLTHPEKAMDNSGSGANLYGSWIFWRHLAERFPDDGGTGMPLVIRDVVSRLGSSGVTDEGEYSTQAMRSALSARGASVSEVFSGFGTANRRPRATYEEGALYPVAPLASTLKLRNKKAKAVTSRPVHLSNSTFRVVPGAALTGKRWKLRVGVDMPKRSFGYAAAVTTWAKGGGVTTEQVSLAADGDGSLVTTFGRQRVKAVEVTLTNASIRYSCWQGRAFACQGIPKDDGRVAKATVKAVR